MADFYGAGFSAGLAGAERLNRIIADKMEQEVSETLHRQHIANGSTATEYTRVGFTSKSAAGDFVAQLNQHDIESAVIATKINGQYLVEIPKETAQQQIEEFNQSGHGYATDAINGYGTVSDNKLANDATGFESAYSNFILENIDTLGSAVLKVNNAIDTIDRQFNISSRLENMSDSQMSLHDQSQAIFAGIYEENERKIQELNAKRGVQEYVPEDFQNYVDQLKAERENVVNSFTAEEQQLLLTLSSGGVNEAILQKAIDDTNANKQYAEASQLGQDLDKFLKEQSANELTSEQALAAFRETKDSLTGDKTLREAWKEQGIQSLHDGKFYLGDKESADKYIKARELADKIQKEGILNTTEAALERDLGISLTASLSYKDVLKANSAFLEEIKKRKIGMNVLDKKGNINVTAVALLKGSGQFDNKTLDFIIKTNQKQWTKMEKYGLGATLSTRLGSAYGKLAKALSKTGDAETNQMLRGISKTTSYTKKTVAAVKQYKNAMVNKRNLRKGLDTGKNDSVVKFKTQKEKTKKFNEEKFAKRAAKHEKAGQKAVARLNRRENSLRARAHRRFEEFKARMMNRLMQTKLGGLAFKLGAKASALKIKAKKFAMQLLIKISPVLGVILGFEAVLVIAICCIESIANFLVSLLTVGLGSYFNESAAFVLINHLQNIEDTWVSEVRGSDEGDFAYKNRDELKFGLYEQSFKTYIASTPISIDADNKVYINPFHKVDGLVVPDGNNNVALTALDGFDGRITASFASNLNGNGQNGIGKYNETVGVESGHTSNIKDIVSMVEVMMDMDSANSTDDNVFGKSPAALDFETFITNAGKVFKNIGTFFANVFTGNGAGNESDYDWDLETSPWKRMSNYAAALFSMTHNAEINLSVDYYNLDSPLDTLEFPTVYDDGTEGSPTKLGIDPVAVGVCPDPTYTPFKLFWDKTNNKPVPCLEKDGTIYRLDNGYFDVTLNMSNLASDDDCKNNKENQEQVCLWSGMANDNATLERIAGGAITFDTTTGEITRENEEGLSCWALTEASNSDTNNVVTGSYTGHDCTTSASADQKAIDACNEKLTTARENAEKNFEENAEKYADNYYLDLTGGVDGDKFTVTLYRLATDTPKVTSRTSHVYEWTTTDSDPTPDDPDHTKETKHSETHYNATATATVYWKFKLTFTRHCKGDTEDDGHYFKYCGGHVCTHTTGMVLSITNEQLAYAGAYNSADENPVVENFEEHYEQGFYEDLLGKYDQSKMDYTTIYSLRKSCSNPLVPPFHPQGTFAPWYASGMNINVPFQPTSEQAGKDISAFDGMEVYGTSDGGKTLSARMLNDIFDADCLLMKGNNCLPTLTAKTWQQYEGWTADNMTIAGAKVTVDWLSAYGIDSPLELGGLPISTTTDTDAIIKALKETYGAKFTEERETAVKEALYWVGRAHYNNDDSHKDHAFLTEMHRGETEYSTEQYDAEYRENAGITTATKFYKEASCTATNSEGFISYVLYKSNASGVAGAGAQDLDKGTLTWSPFENEDTSNLLPADVLMHKASNNDEGYLDALNGYVIDYERMEEKSGNEAGFWFDQPPVNLYRKSSNQGVYEEVPYKLGEDVLMAYNEERYVFYVGTINKDIVLTNGTVIRAGEPITIDIVPYFGMGTVRLHTRTPNDFLLDVGQTDYYRVDSTGGDYPLDWSPDPEAEEGTEVSPERMEVLAADSMPRYSYFCQYWVCHPDSRTYVYHFKTAS